jgi:Transposase DDE domain group 1
VHLTIDGRLAGGLLNYVKLECDIGAHSLARLGKRGNHAHYPRSFTGCRELRVPIRGSARLTWDSVVCRRLQNPSREGTREVNSNSTVPVVVEMGGSGVVAHVGLHLLGSFADRLGLGDSLSRAIVPGGERLPAHDRGKVLTQAMLMLAGGGEACSDIEHLRAQPALFGAVPSDSTLYRTFCHLDADTLTALRAAFAEVRVKAWRRMAATAGTAPIVFDVDSSLHEVHSENKAETAPHYKGGYGF